MTDILDTTADPKFYDEPASIWLGIAGQGARKLSIWELYALKEAILNQILWPGILNECKLAERQRIEDEEAYRETLRGLTGGQARGPEERQAPENAAEEVREVER